MTVKLIWTTPDTEAVIAHCARVSSPHNQDNPDYEGLLKYCIRNNHISIFEMASACLEIQCSRTIARQILRHRSFSFQEFSQRYAQVAEMPLLADARSQDLKNRQNSVDDMDELTKEDWTLQQLQVWNMAQMVYKNALAMGIAKEVARSVIPEGMAQTTMYMTGTVRSWINFLDVRWQGPGVQLECRNVAQNIATILQPIIPTIFKAKEWEV